MNAPATRDRCRYLLPVIVVIGIFFRLVQYLYQHSYWHDESYLVLNIVEGNFRDAFGELKLFQSAPPAFLMVQILMWKLFGASEYALRFVPLVLGCASVALMAGLSSRIGGRFVACLATVMFAASDRLIWHAVECKQYAGDVFVALVLLLLSTGNIDRRRLILIAVLASAAIWFSHTTLFVFGGISLVTLFTASFVRSRMGAAAYGLANALFAVSLIAVYLTAMRHQQYDYMYEYWSNDFVPWRKPLMVPVWLIKKTFDLFNYGYENAGPVLLVLAVIGTRSWWKTGDRRHLILLTLPLGLNLFASALHRFPFSGSRVTLYITPSLFLLAATGAGHLVRRATLISWRRAAWALPIALTAFGLIGAAYHLVVPRHRGQPRPSARFVAAHRTNEEPIYVVGIVEPWKCYLTDPAIPWRRIEPANAADISDERFWIVYASSSSREEKRQHEALLLAEKRASICDDFETAGSTAVHFERTTVQPSH